uniref:Glycolate oxidase FAD binding subunit n=1 Tax=Candidatus Kentrum sp. FM TaxID=2126340 RepID=A0A450SQT1_9GAMM|nr:MAG: glycolate oxidase FAD binding subunit [Candidatus Kentron sp. FM]VFJ56594.1 MAG: glycolate oxidase FAD binding subunit [Candidatus Kentron sp. FM]VFK11255.1 MAG: glycolate oxidase FAD binding subunit [Candidatus Kentron sp. FM]
MTKDIGSELCDTILDAIPASTGGGSVAFRITGGGSKHFLGREVAGTPLSTADHEGIISYEPKELFITARCGTRLTRIEQTLAEHGQLLPFEPPHFDPAATLGGTVATGLSGPRRPYAGAVRDLVMGVRLINGRGEVLRFGGEVMKNVAGYDLSRLMTGAMGCLGLILEASLKVIPAPDAELTLVREHAFQEAIEHMNTWAGRPLPLSGACCDGERLYVRLSGANSAVRAAREKLGGEVLEDGHRFWSDLREQRHPFFAGEDGPLWRLAVPPATPFRPLATELKGRWLLEWGGGQRWLRPDAQVDAIQAATEVDMIRSAVQDAGGHATLFRGGDRTGEVFHPLPPILAKLHRRLKAAFDPHRLFNPGRLYPRL